MSFRQSIVRLAQHARTPAIRFPDRSVKPTPHAAEAHPCAPPDAIESFSRFQSSQKNPKPALSQSSSYGGPGLPPQTGGGEASSSSGSILGGEEELPAWLSRKRYAPTEEEIEAVMTGGASASPLPKDYKFKWYTAQI